MPDIKETKRTVKIISDAGTLRSGELVALLTAIIQNTQEQVAEITVKAVSNEGSDQMHTEVTLVRLVSLPQRG
jgi:hypothetical protein